VKLVNFFFVFGCDDRPFQLHGRGQQVVFWRPQLRDERDFLGDLELCELLRLALRSASFCDFVDDCLLLAERLELTADSQLSGQRDNARLLRADQRHRPLATCLSVAHGHINELAELQGGLYLRQCHILAIGALPEVLLTINDLQATTFSDLPDVPCAEETYTTNFYPIFLVLCCQLGVWRLVTDVVTLVTEGPPIRTSPRRMPISGLSLSEFM